MSSTTPDNNMTAAEVERLRELESLVERGRDSHAEVETALAEIRDARLYRDIHETIDEYLRERWAMDRPTRPEGSEALAKAWEQALQEFGRKEVTAADIRFTVYKRRRQGEVASEPHAQARPAAEMHRGPAAEAQAGKLLPQLRWLLTKSSGTIAEVAHRLETRGVEIDDDAREQLQDDLLVLDEELATLKSLLAGPVDWDAEYERLMAGEIPPFEGDDDEA
jgi:hypothetical protein